jgi:hypothetical protein
MTAPSDTHRRAKIRGRESIAQWRIKSGVWAARIFAVMIGVVTILPLVRQSGPDWITAAVFVLLTAGILFAAQKMSGGNRTAACIVLGLFIAVKLADWLFTDQPVWNGLLWTVVIFGGMCNGVWGTFSLAQVKRDALLVPPAPETSAKKRIDRSFFDA